MAICATLSIVLDITSMAILKMKEKKRVVAGRQSRQLAKRMSTNAPVKPKQQASYVNPQVIYVL